MDLFHDRFLGNLMAHPILPFNFGDGGHICLSIEARREAGEKSTPFGGLYKIFELQYIFASEEDVVRGRTNIREEPVFLYKSAINLSELRGSVRRVTHRNNPHSMKTIIDEGLNPILKGGFGYFKHAHVSELRELDHWIRMWLCSILRKRAGGKGRAHLKWKNCYFKELGRCFLADSRAE